MLMGIPALRQEALSPEDEQGSNIKKKIESVYPMSGREELVSIVMKEKFVYVCLNPSYSTLGTFTKCLVWRA